MNPTPYTLGLNYTLSDTLRILNYTLLNCWDTVLYTLGYIVDTDYTPWVSLGIIGFHWDYIEITLRAFIEYPVTAEPNYKSPDMYPGGG